MLSHKALPVRTIMFGKMHMMVNSAIGQNVKSGAAYFDLIVNVLSLGLWACACIDRYCKEQRISLFQRRGTGIFQSYAQSPTSLNVGAIEIGYRGMKNPTDPIGEFARREGRPGVVIGKEKYKSLLRKKKPWRINIMSLERGGERGWRTGAANGLP